MKKSSWTGRAISVVCITLALPGLGIPQEQERGTITRQIGATLEQIRRSSSVAKAEADRQQLLFLQQQQLAALNRLVTMQAAPCPSSGSFADSVIAAMEAAERTAALSRQTRAQSALIEATTSLQHQLAKSFETSASPDSRILRMSQRTYRDSGLASLTSGQAGVFEDWLKEQGIAIEIVEVTTGGQPEAQPTYANPSGIWRMVGDETTLRRVTIADDRLYVEQLFNEEQKRNWYISYSCELLKASEGYAGECVARYTVALRNGGTRPCENKTKAVATSVSPTRIEGKYQTPVVANQTLTQSDWESCLRRFPLRWETFIYVRPN